MSLDTGGYKRLFPKKYIPPILSSLFEAGGSLRKETNSDLEDWLTRRLIRRLKQNPIFRDGPLTLALKAEIVSNDKGEDSHAASGEIDIYVSCERGAEVYFAIEAKRLRVHFAGGRMEAGSSLYVDKGMMRFVLGQYAPLMRAGAMLGYVFDGNTVEARKGIDRVVQIKAEELKLMSPRKLGPSAILPGSSIDETNHQLVKRIFTIYHVLLAV